jgi:hypothetical protein
MGTRLGALHVAVVAVLSQLGCGGSATPAGSAKLDGTIFGAPFVARDVLLVHPQTWKSAAAGSTAILISDTPGLCAQITSGKTTAPGRLLAVRLEQRDGAGGIVSLTAGTFTRQGDGLPSSRFGDVYASAVDAACQFNKLFTDAVQIDITSIGQGGATLGGSIITAHYADGESLTGGIAASSSCDEGAVDTYLNRNPTCG